MIRINYNKQRGFTLIEALFSSIVLGIGLLALAGFHAVALQDGTAVKMRMVATNLAQEKLDDLKSFIRLRDDPAIDEDGDGVNNNDCGAGKFCYSEIASNGGGLENGGGLALPNATDTISGTAYTRSWTVVCYSEAAGAVASVNADCSDADFKLVTVTIAWTDNKGVGQSTSLENVIYGVDPANMARAMANPAPPPGPKVTYTPIGVPDAVPVPISSGDGKYKESSKPLPDVSSKGYSLRTEFDAVSYTSVGGVTKKDAQLEFATVNCVCEFAGTGTGYPASYFYWDGIKLRIKTPAAMVSKMTGTAPSISGDQQDELCTSCCRDHHDSEAPGAGSPTTALYDPDRPTADYTGNNHKHYYYQDVSQPQLGLVEVAESAGNRYLEACRFTRVDGIYRLLQDWRAIDMVVMPKLSYLEVNATLAAYQAYLLNYLRYQSREDCTSASATGCANIDQSAAPLKSTLVTRDLLNHAVDTSDGDQLLARALYSDRVYGKTTPRTLDTTYYTALASKINDYESDSSVTWLDRVPFNEVNVTLLASWHSDDTDSVSVTNSPILSLSSTTPDYYGVTLRGKTTVKSTGDGSASISAHLLPSNSGLTGGVTRPTYTGTTDYDVATLLNTGTAIPYSSEIGTDRHDHASTGRKSNSILITRSGAVSPSSGTLLGGNSSVDLTGIAVAEYPSGTACTVETTSVLGSTASGTFKCSDSYTGQVQITLAGHFFNNALDANSNYKYDDGGSYTSLNTCTAGSCGNFWVFGPSVNIFGACNGSVCTDTNVSVTSHLNDGATGVACTIVGSTIACPVALDSVTKIWEGTFKIANKAGMAYYLKADATSCDSNDGTGEKKTSNAPMVSAGPADKQAAFNLCASDMVATPPPPTQPTVVSLAIVGSNTVNTASFQLIWADVPDETGYVVYKCTVANSNSTCAPNQAATGTLAANTTTTTQSVDNLDSLCLNVVAVNAGGSSLPSQTMCVYYKKNLTPVITGPL